MRRLLRRPRGRIAHPARLTPVALLLAFGASPVAASPHPTGSSAPSIAAPSLGLTDLVQSLRALQIAAAAAATADRERPTSATEPAIEPPGWQPPPVPEGGFPYRPLPEPAPRVIRYTVSPGETLQAVAERFETTVDDLTRRNKLRPGRLLRAGKTLDVFAQRFPVPRLRVRYLTRPGDTWESIAAGYGIPVEALKAYNPKARRLRRLPAKLRLDVWAESALPRFVEYGPWLPWTFAPTAPEGSLSRGYPTGGRLTAGARLPESPDYTLRTPDTAYGSTHAMQVIQHAIAAFRHETAYLGEVLVCSLSKRRGGRFPPHRSHRTGRDVDIGLVAYPGFPRGEGHKARGGEVDWAATWLLMRHFIETEQVTYIFLSYHLQPALYEAALALGATDEELSRVIQWPRKRRAKTSAIVRHAAGHTGHFHVRIKCGPDEPRCKGA